MLRRTVLGFPFVAARTVLGANDRIELGFVGVGRRATWLLQHEDFGSGRVRAIADCSAGALAKAGAGRDWVRYSDYREMFAKEKLDGVFVETTTHARARIAIQAMEAGLDVFAEKPVTLTIAEGQALVKAARTYKRVFQAGTQQRSMPINLYASSLVAEGKLGRIKKVIVCNFLAPARWGEKPAEAVPEGLNWDEWCNQTELRPYHSELHRGWMKWRDYDGGGQSWGVSGWGTHSLDQVQAALGTSLTGPVEITPGAGGAVALRYATGTVVALEQEIIQDHQQLGAIFEGTEGRMQILRGDFRCEERPEFKKEAPGVLPEGPGENAYHILNFLECMRSRKRPNADVEIAHRSTSVCQLVNIARELGRTLRWDPEREAFRGDEEANGLRERERRKGYELPSLG
jgi:predicted dehydrogenase